MRAGSFVKKGRRQNQWPVWMESGPSISSQWSGTVVGSFWSTWVSLILLYGIRHRLGGQVNRGVTVSTAPSFPRLLCFSCSVVVPFPPSPPAKISDEKRERKRGGAVMTLGMPVVIQLGSWGSMGKGEPQGLARSGLYPGHYCHTTLHTREVCCHTLSTHQ